MLDQHTIMLLERLVIALERQNELKEDEIKKLDTINSSIRYFLA